MANYMNIISHFFPDTPATCVGDESDFSNITFLSNAKTQAELDAKSLDLYKVNKNAEIDKRTAELILTSGIVYDSVVFSSSETAQRNWLALDQFKAFHTYPVSVTADDDSEYSFSDAAAVEAFVLTGMATINAHYGSGRQLKISVAAASDIAGVDAVVDNR